MEYLQQELLAHQILVVGVVETRHREEAELLLSAILTHRTRTKIFLPQAAAEAAELNIPTYLICREEQEEEVRDRQVGQMI